MKFGLTARFKRSKPQRGPFQKINHDINQRRVAHGPHGCLEIAGHQGMAIKETIATTTTAKHLGDATLCASDKVVNSGDIES